MKLSSTDISPANHSLDSEIPTLALHRAVAIFCWQLEGRNHEVFDLFPVSDSPVVENRGGNLAEGIIFMANVV